VKNEGVKRKGNNIKYNRRLRVGKEKRRKEFAPVLHATIFSVFTYLLYSLVYVKVKLSVCLINHHAIGTYEGMEIQLHLFLTFALGRGLFILRFINCTGFVSSLTSWFVNNILKRM
jgi:hypothetical protein